MIRIPVQSSNLISIGYDFSNMTLEVEFKNGRVYQYYDVPQAEHDGLMAAGSHGIYFNQNIRNAYRCAQV